jgi:hypothetical protein
MASTFTTGTLTYIKVNKQAGEGEDFCFFGLTPTGAKQAEVFILWWALASGVPTPTAADWVLRNATLLLLRDALLNKMPVTVSTDDVSAIVATVQLGQ